MADINVFTAAMRTEFNNAWAAISKDAAPHEAFTTVIPSTARIENYTHMSPAPGLAEYVGHRRLANLSSVKYTVTNKEFDGSFSVLTRDIEDDQGIAGYKMKPAELASNAAAFPGRLALNLLGIASGNLSGSSVCFDGSNFFADSHTLGTGDNNLTYDCASNDAVTHRLVMMYTGGPLKPLIYQNRKPPKFMDNYSEKTSAFAKQVDYWVDMEGAAAFGYWWNAVLVTITDTPTVVELQTILGNAINAFRGFYLPKALSEDPTVYPHEQTKFTTANSVVAVSGRLGELIRQVLSMPVIAHPTTGVGLTNVYNGTADYVVTNYLGT